MTASSTGPLRIKSLKPLNHKSKNGWTGGDPRSPITLRSKMEAIILTLFPWIVFISLSILRVGNIFIRISISLLGEYLLIMYYMLKTNIEEKRRAKNVEIKKI